MKMINKILINQIKFIIVVIVIIRNKKMMIFSKI